MPKKQNGFGNVNSRFFNGFAGVEYGSGVGAAGYYPSYRGFGSSAHLSVIEKWDRDSSWARWRKALEYHTKTAFIDLQVKNENYDAGEETSATNQPFIKANLSSTLYSGTPYEYDSTFTGWIFPTNNSDVGSYYVVKRDPENIELGTITAILNDPEVYTTNWANQELVVTFNPNATYGRLLYQIIGERICDGDYSTENRTEATLKEVLTADGKPTIYVGKTVPKGQQDQFEFLSDPTQIELTIPTAQITITEPVLPEEFEADQGINYRVETTGKIVETVKPELDPDNRTEAQQTKDGILANPSLLEGRIIYLPNFYFDKAISSVTKGEFSDEDFHFEFELEDQITDQDIICFDRDVNRLPPSMHDVTNLPKIFTATGCTWTIKGSYVFKKDLYQPLFPKTYLTASRIEEEVENVSYIVMPFKILGATVSNGNLTIKSIPYNATIELFAPIEDGMKLVFSDYSFAITNPSTRNTSKTILDVTIDPWLKDTKIFSANQPLRPAITYSCGCPAFSKAIIAQPQSGQDGEERKTNRQYQYPMPSAMSPSDFEKLGASAAAGKFNSWETTSDKLGLRMCKHTIAAMFDDNVNMQEPSDYPSEKQRYDFEVKLESEIGQAQLAFDRSYKRTGISTTEVVYALSTGLNLDITEIAFIVLD